MKSVRVLVVALLVLGAAAVLVGCNNHDRTDISAILDNTDGYMHRDVTIGGRVTKTYAANLGIAEAGAYQVDDGTGKIWVVTKNGVPEKGQEVGLKGTVAGGLRIGGESFGAIVREIDRRAR